MTPEALDPRACEFDGVSLWKALDEQREAEGLTWNGVARRLRDLDSGLAARLGKHNHPIAASTIAKMRSGQPPGCHFALGYLRWLDAVPEAFLTTGDPLRLAAPLPPADSFHRLRWDVPRLAAHRMMAEWFGEYGVAVRDPADVYAANAQVAASVDAVPITGRAGDVVFAHHLLVHTVGPHAGPDIRYAVFFRLRVHPWDHYDPASLTDPWHEFEGMGP